VPEEQIPMEDLDAKVIFHIKSTLSGFQRYLRELHRIRGSRCARCNGATILRKRLHGKEKKS
jgi:hypothetical protein